MRRTLITLAFLGASAILAHADTEWNGSLCFNSATPQCTAAGWNPNGCFNIRYAPRNVGANGPDTELSLFNPGFAAGFRLASGNPVSSTPYTVTIAKVARGGYTYPVGFRFATQIPAVPTLTTATISMTGFFTDWDQIAGCTYGFRAAATLNAP